MVWIQPDEPFRFLPLWNNDMVSENETVSQPRSDEESDKFETVPEQPDPSAFSETDMTTSSPVISTIDVTSPSSATIDDENSEIKNLMNEAFVSTLPNNCQQQLIDKIRAEPKFISQIGLTPTKV